MAKERQKQPAKLLLISLLGTCAAVGIPDGAKAAESEAQTLVLKQTHPYLQEVNIQLTKNAMLVQIPSHHIDLFTQAPDWTVTIRNSIHHAYLKMPYQKWIVTGMIGATNIDSPIPAWSSVPSGSLNYKGLPAKKFIFPRMFKNGTAAPLSAGDEGYAFAYQGKEATEQEARVLDTLLNRWSVPGLQIKSHRARGSIIVPYRSDNREVATTFTVDTISWQKSKLKPTLDLKGYQLTDKQNQVWLSNTEGEMLKDLLAP